MDIEERSGWARLAKGDSFTEKQAEKVLVALNAITAQTGSMMKDAKTYEHAENFIGQCRALHSTAKAYIESASVGDRTALNAAIKDFTDYHESLLNNGESAPITSSANQLAGTIRSYVDQHNRYTSLQSGARSAAARSA